MHCTVDALALAAVLAQPWADVVLSGAATAEQGRSNVNALDVILQAAATRSLSHVIADTGREIGDLGENEIDEGVLRMEVSEIAAQRSEELSVAGDLLASRGAARLAVGVAAGEVAREMVVEGTREMAAGAADMAESESLDDLAQTLAARAE